MLLILHRIVSLHGCEDEEDIACDEGSRDPEPKIDEPRHNNVDLDEFIEECDVAEILAAAIGLFQKVNDVFNPQSVGLVPAVRDNEQDGVEQDGTARVSQVGQFRKQKRDTPWIIWLLSSLVIQLDNLPVRHVVEQTIEAYAYVGVCLLNDQVKSRMVIILTSCANLLLIRMIRRYVENIKIREAMPRNIQKHSS